MKHPKAQALYQRLMARKLLGWDAWHAPIDPQDLRAAVADVAESRFGADALQGLEVEISPELSSISEYFASGYGLNAHISEYLDRGRSHRSFDVFRNLLQYGPSLKQPFLSKDGEPPIIFTEIADFSATGLDEGVCAEVMQTLLGNARTEVGMGKKIPEWIIWQPLLKNTITITYSLCMDSAGNKFGLASLGKNITPISFSLALQMIRFDVEQSLEPHGCVEIELVDIALFLAKTTASNRSELDDLKKRARERDVAHKTQLEDLRNQLEKRRKDAIESKREELIVLSNQLNTARQQIAKLTGDVSRLSKALEAAPKANAAEAERAASQRAMEESAEADDVTYWRELAQSRGDQIRQLQWSIKNDSAPSADHGAVQEISGQAAEPKVRRLSDLSTWASDNADRIIILKRAIHSARKSVYEDDELVYRALDILAGVYRDVKLGLQDRSAYKAAADAAGLEMGGSIEMPSEHYFFHWNGRRTFLDTSIGRGNSRDPRYCMRVYFTWDDAEQKVIVGWLPSHLPTKAT